MSDQPKSRAKRATPQQSKFTPEVADRIILLVGEGNYFTTAAVACGIGETTIYTWRRKGRAGEQPYADWLVKLNAAQRGAEMALVNVIRETSAKSWQAAAWLLERMHPQRYTRDREEAALRKQKLRLEIEALKKGASPVAIALTPGDAEFEQLMRLKWGGTRQGSRLGLQPLELPLPDGSGEGEGN